MLRTSGAVCDVTCKWCVTDMQILLCMMYYHFHCCDQIQRQSFNVTLTMFSLSLANFSGGRSIERCLDSD